jgi:hypothetical protein
MSLLIQASYAKGEIAPALYGRVDTAVYQSALRTARNVIVRAYGSISNRTGLTFIGPVKDHSYPPRLIEFQFNTTDTYQLEFGDFYMRVIRNDAYVLESAFSITAITAAHPPVVTAAGHGYANGDEVYLQSVVGMTRVNQRRFLIKNATTNTFTLADQVTDADIDATAYAAYASGGTVARVYTLVSPYAIADTLTLDDAQSADVMTLTHQLYAPRELTRTDHDNWAFTTPAFAPSTASPTGVAVAAGGGTVTRNYAVTFSATTTFEESLPTLITTTTGATPSADVITWTAGGSGIANASIYLQQNGVYGLLGTSDTTSFTNANIGPDLTTSPPAARNPFVGAGNYPATVSYYMERRVFGGTLNQPDTTFYSQVASAANMSSSSPIQDDDAITATLNSQQVNAIKHFVPGTDLLTFTSGSEWQTNAGNASNFSATTLTQHPQSIWGCSYIAPITMGKTVLFVTENQSTVRNLGFDWQVNGYTGQDVSLLASHLFSNYKIVDWSLARTPDPIIHTVREDGQACLLTFNQEQSMIAWTHWDTQGSFERTSSLRHNATEIDEAVYFVVKRRVNGNTVRYIERIASRRFIDVRDAFYVDAGLTYDFPIDITSITLGNPTIISAPAHGFVSGDQIDLFDIEWQTSFDDMGNEIEPAQLNTSRYAATVIDANTFSVPIDSTLFAAYVEGGTARKAVRTITGLDHLEGCAVSVLADGNVVKGLVVSQGAITLPRKFSRVHVGLQYISDIETLDIEAPGGGTMQGTRKKTSTVTVRFDASRGLLIGPTSDDLTEMKQREDENMGDPTALLTGDKQIVLEPSWNSNGRIFLRQVNPLPMNILAIIPDLINGT